MSTCYSLLHLSPIMDITESYMRRLNNACGSKASSLPKISRECCKSEIYRHFKFLILDVFQNEQTIEVITFNLTQSFKIN